MPEIQVATQDRIEGKLTEYCPMTLDELFEIYIGKNVLNRFRQAHGYKSGEYHKVWDGREDNEHLAEIVSTLDPERPDYPEQVLAELESRYPSNAA